MKILERGQVKISYSWGPVKIPGRGQVKISRWGRVKIQRIEMERGKYPGGED